MVWLALLLGLASACAGLPNGATAPSALPSPREVMSRLEARRVAVRSFALQGEIELKGPEGELYGDHLIQGVFPNRLRAEVLGPFGRPLLLVVTDGRQLTALDYQANRAYRGPASRGNLARFLGLGLSAGEIYALLSGNPPLIPDHDRRVLPAAEPGQAQLRLLGPGDAVLESVVFALGDYTVLRAWLRRGGEGEDGPALKCRYGEFRPAPGGRRFPAQVELEDAKGHTVRLLSEQLLINPRLEGRLFEPVLPPGIEVVDLP